MKIDDLLRSRPGIVGIGVLTFAVLALVSLLSITDGGDHPLALETDVPLCELLGNEVWVELQYPATDAIARVPEDSQSNSMICALELEPVAPGDRWARIARGDDADKVRRIASVMISTTATLRQQSPNIQSDNYTATFDQELVASGWSASQIEGPWTWGAVYTTSEGKVAALVEDHGVVFWATAKDVSAENMVSFTHSAAEKMRNGS